MVRPVEEGHGELAARLRDRVAGSGLLDRAVRLGAMRRGAGGGAMAEPFDELARQVGQAASRVTDAQVAAVREATGSDALTFEVVLSAAIGAGLRRWDAAADAITRAADATG
jgi:hypothetical protein